MPYYDYYCEKNNKTVEVMHPMKDKLKTWAEVCKAAKIDPDKTPADTPVIRLISGVTPTIFRTKGLDKDEPSDRLLV